jgi:uncharacterized protein (DUF433 family)
MTFVEIFFSYCSLSVIIPDKILPAMSTINLIPHEWVENPTEHPHVVFVDHSPFVRSSRIRVRLIAQMHREGDTVSDILRAYPHLSATAIHDAISYYLDHLSEIEKEIAESMLEKSISALGASINERGFITFPRKN